MKITKNLSTVKIFAWLFTLVTMLMSAVASAAPYNGLQKLGGIIQSKPIILSNTPLTGRLKNLVDEMKLKNFSDRDLLTGIFSANEFEKSSILMLIDREAGNIPFELESISPSVVREGYRNGGDTSNLAMLQIFERPGGKKTIVIVAPNRESLVQFMTTDVRDDKKITDYKEVVKTRRVQVLPSPPTIIFPKGKINSTRPPVFFLARKTDQSVRYTVQVQPRGTDREPQRQEFGGNVASGASNDGWVDFDASVELATRYELDAWGVKVPSESKRRGFVTYVYHPNFDVGAGRDYTIRIRSQLAEEDDSKPGAWSSQDEVVVYTVPPQPENLETATRITRAENYDAGTPAYSADGKYVIYAVNKANPYVFEIFAGEANSPVTGQIKVSASNRLSQDFNPTWGPALSPTVSTVAFDRRERGSRGGSLTTRSIWQVAMGLTPDAQVPAGMTRITEGSDDSFAPAYSPDGKKLAYCVTSSRGETEIWVKEAGNGPRVLMSGLQPVWDTDGVTLYYSSNEAGSWDIWKLNTATGRKTQLTTDAGNEFSPRPSPTGNGDVVYTGTATGNYDIYLLRNGGSIRLTEWIGNDTDPTWSPDGKHIVYCTTRFSNNRRIDIASIEPKSK